MRVGIIGMGNMGSKYALFIAKGEVKGMELAAIPEFLMTDGKSLKGMFPLIW